MPYIQWNEYYAKSVRLENPRPPLITRKMANLTLKKQLIQRSIASKDALRIQIKGREDFWINKLETLATREIKPRTV